MNAQAVEDLNALLKGELSAVETYSQALEKVENERIASVFSDCLASHKTRVEKLQNAITEYGGTPESETGIWGSWSKILAGGAAALGDKASIAALEEEEDQHSSDYEWRLVNMHGEHRNLVKEELLPEQQTVRSRLSALLNDANDGAWPPTPEPMKEI